MGECEKDLWVAGKISWYQQRDYQTLVIEFSDGKLKPKGFFHSVPANNNIEKTLKKSQYGGVSFRRALRL
jgi:hypothetical protein